MPWFIFPVTRLFLASLVNAATGKMFWWLETTGPNAIPLTRGQGYMLSGMIICSLPLALAFDILVIPAFSLFIGLLWGFGWFIHELDWIAHGAK